MKPFKIFGRHLSVGKLRKKFNFQFKFVCLFVIPLFVHITIIIQDFGA